MAEMGSSQFSWWPLERPQTWPQGGNTLVVMNQVNTCCAKVILGKIFHYLPFVDIKILWAIVILCHRRQGPGPWFNINISSYQYRNSHCGDKTVIRSSYLHNGISYTGKMTIFLLNRPHVILLDQLHNCWWPDNTRNWGIPNHSIDPFIVILISANEWLRH